LSNESLVGLEFVVNSMNGGVLFLDLWTGLNETTTNSTEVQIPANWTTSCYNTENGIYVSTLSGYYASPSRMLNMSLSLRSKPISELGPVNVTAVIYGENAMLVREDGSKLDYVQFDSDNWNIPVPIFAKYAYSGFTDLRFIANGGGYDIPHVEYNNQEPVRSTRSDTYTVWTCDDSPLSLDSC